MQKFLRLGQRPVLLSAPSIAILLVVFGVPLVVLFVTSLNAPAYSVQNYLNFFAQPANIRVLIQTVEMSGVTTAICILVGYPTAYLIVSASPQARTAMIVLIVIPYLTSLLARTYAWIMILGDRGLINNLLLHYGLISSPLPLIYNRTAVYVGMVHIMLPTMILPLVSVMLGINKSLVSAARSMGARPLTAFWRVFFPLSLPGLRSGALLVFVLSLGFYITPAALGGVRDVMLSTFIAAQVAGSFNMARVATASFVLLAVTLLVLSIFGLDFAGGETTTYRTRRWGFKPLILGCLRFLREFAVPYRAHNWAAQLHRAGSGARLGKVAGTTFLILMMVFLLFPGAVVVIMSFSPGATLEFPPTGLSLQWYRSFFNDPSWNGALITSIEIGIAVTILSTAAGTLAAYGLSRTSARLRSWFTTLLLMPITVPVIVVAIAAYLGLVRIGLLGTTTGLVLAHSLGGIAYVVVIVSATLVNFDRRLEQAAQSMKAGPLRTFRRVTLPLILPGVIGGAVFAFISSFDELVISSLVSGLSIRTLPLKMWENIRHEIDPTIAAVASLLMLLPILWLGAIYLTWWRSRTPAKVA
ncbi:ABC transporter permease subunit [Mesorhizobium sp. B4-1-4]|uniref:ABC transporter permease subunit n=1 Tax=Mesorhizobium sp. B4-1-4 TaxID=2589888 RepID=UPI00112DEEAB|nr:ABC transporter permease subunit [Mesorhizobium sp. B4-1-4]UCI31892.1 ABC transporter permease subunit [Mesorhizobium sp. B4-1-4]